MKLKYTKTIEMELEQGKEYQVRWKNSSTTYTLIVSDNHVWCMWDGKSTSYHIETFQKILNKDNIEYIKNKGE